MAMFGDFVDTFSYTKINNGMGSSAEGRLPSFTVKILAQLSVLPAMM